MKLTFLGTGSAFTDFRVNYHNNALVQVAERSWVMIDCGATAVQSIKELDIKPWEIAAVIITHIHGDHVAGLEQLLWERYYTGPFGPGFESTRVLATKEVLAELRKVVEPCVDIYTSFGGNGHGGYKALVVETEVHPGEELWLGSVGFVLLRTPHVEGPNVSKDAFGVKLHSPHGSCYYTSDTMFRAEIGRLFPTGLIFHDCTFYPPFPGMVHTAYVELLTLPRDVRARIVLMHYTAIPEGVDVLADGFAGAAKKHEVFEL